MTLSSMEMMGVCVCTQAVNVHQRLDAFVSGDQPHYLMPTAPRGYIIQRLLQLSQGPCMGLSPCTHMAAHLTSMHAHACSPHHGMVVHVH